MSGYYPYPRMAPYPPLPGPFPPPPQYGFHPSMRPPASYMYPSGAVSGSPFMLGSVGGMLSPPPPVQPQQHWNTATSYPVPVSAASPVGPTNMQQPPPTLPQHTSPYLMQHLHQQPQHQPHQPHMVQLQHQPQHQPQPPHLQQSSVQQHSGLPAPQGSTDPASLASLANLAPFLSRPHVQPAPQPIHATCLSCQHRLPMPQLTSNSTHHERISCPSCHCTLLAADVIRAAEEEHFYTVLEPYSGHFDVHNAALAWLSQSKPTRTGKLAVPRAFRWPKSTAGKGGYADAFVAMGLVLRRNDTASGHWHCWYVERGNATFQSMQAAITRRWKDSPNYKDGLLTAVDGDDGEDGDEEAGTTVAEGGGRKRERDDGADDSEYIERDFSSAAAPVQHAINDAVDYNAHVVDIRERSRESGKREKRDSGTHTPVRKAAGGGQDAGSTTPRSVKDSTSDETATSSTATPAESNSATEYPADGDEQRVTSPVSSSSSRSNTSRPTTKLDTHASMLPDLSARTSAHLSSATASPASSPMSSDSSLSSFSSPVSTTPTFSSNTLGSIPLASLVSQSLAPSVAAAASSNAPSLSLTTASPPSMSSSSSTSSASSSSSPSPPPSSSAAAPPQRLTPLQA